MTSTKVADYMSQFERNDNSEKSKKVGKFETLRKLLSFSRPELPKIILGFSALVVNAATNLSFPWILGEAVDQTRFSNHNEHIYFIFGAAGLFVIASAASFIRVYCLGTATESISTRLRKILFRSYIDKDMDFFDENKKGQLITILNKDVTVASELITEKLAAGIRSINSSLNGSILLFASSPYLFSISIGMLPIIGIGAMSLSKTSKVLTQKLRNMESNILSFALERFSSITTIRLYGREHFENNSFSHQLDDYTNTSIHNSYVKSSLMSFINLSTNLSLCIVLYVGGILIKQGKMTPGELTKFALQSAFVGLGFSGLSVLHGDLVTGLSAAER
jgi:ABC-type multidrug transport system fused ATPase/permease subunit